MKKLLSLLLIISTPAYAGNAIKVHTGDVVTKEFNEGTLLDKEQAERIKDQLIERDAFEKESASYKKSVELYKNNEVILSNQKDLLLNQNIKLTETLNDQRDMSEWTKVGYFVLGIAITGAAVYGASQLSKR
jgi:hypothetical protein